MLASDDQNPNFVGAHDPDARLHVEFYDKEIPQEFLTEKEGRPIFKTATMVRIYVPGDKNNTIDTFANDSHKRRFVRQWDRYQRGVKVVVDGTPITEWTLITPSTAKELKYLDFHTVESIASATDSQLQAIGMKGGMLPFNFREKAQQWLARAKDSAAASRDADRIKEQDAALAEQRRAMEEMREQIAQLAANQKAKPGPKAKETETA